MTDPTPLTDRVYTKTKPVLSFIGAGNYASRILIPAFKAAGAQLHTIVTSGGVSGVFHGRKAGFAQASTDVNSMLANAETNTVVIATRHNTHARFVAAAMKAGKNVFVEKPLVINHDDLHAVQTSYDEAMEAGLNIRLMVGFNRRFAPLVQRIKTLLDPINEPKALIMTMNAGLIPAGHWTQDINVGGGRIIGEACHYIDLMRFLIGCPIVSVQCRRIGVNGEGIARAEDNAAIILGFKDGSFGTIHYLANGNKSYPKEQIEIFAAGKVLQLSNFLKLRGFGWKGFKSMNLISQDKGQKACVAAFLSAIEQGLPSPIPANEVFEVAGVTLNVADDLRNQS